MPQRRKRRPRSAFLDGMRDVTGLAPGVFIFGISFGALVRTRTIDPIAGASSSAIVAGGAGQTAAVEILATGGTIAIAVLATLLVNARFALYSAALAPMFSRFSPRWRWGLAYLIADHVVGLYRRGEERWKTTERLQHYMLGITLPMRLSWIVGTIVGVTLGPIVPEAWQLGFIIPLLFIALASPAVKTSAEGVALSVGLLAVVLLKDLPLGLNIVSAILLGVCAGLVVRTEDKLRSATVRTEEIPS
jgi:predicted branched-subunit amino acid permease